MAEVVVLEDEDIDESPQRLYRPIKNQLTPETIPFNVSYVWVTPELAAEWLDQALAHTGFNQRKITQAAIDQWRALYQTNRFAHFLPNGPICRNDAKILMNGGNRLTALARVADPDYRAGFMVIDDCPEWMVDFFDTGKNRSLKEALTIRKKDTDPAIQQLAKLGMRYEEFLFKKRSALGWSRWGRQRDQHVDINDYIDRREYLFDWIPMGKTAKRKGLELLVPSIAAFSAYQRLAWSAGTDEIESFTDSLMFGANLDKGNPALALREWARYGGYIGEGNSGRREGHLLLLFKTFREFVEKQYVEKISAARGMNMEWPYHPSGSEVAGKNVRKALAKMDADYDQLHA